MFERWTTRIESALLRRQLERARVVTKGAVSGRRIVLRNHGQMELGNGVALNSFPQGESFVTSLNTWLPDASLEIGEQVVLNGTVIHARQRIHIGAWTMFGPGCVVIDNDSHPLRRDPQARRGRDVAAAPVDLQSNVWVGMRSLIMKGVTIGENSIIAAGSIVTRDIPANVIAGGAPCKVIRRLTDAD